jgi:hypothetical protein
MTIVECFGVIQAIKMDGPFIILLEAMGWIVSMMETSKLPCPSFRSNFNKKASEFLLERVDYKYYQYYY